MKKSWRIVKQESVKQAVKETVILEKEETVAQGNEEVWN